MARHNLPTALTQPSPPDDTDYEDLYERRSTRKIPKSASAKDVSKDIEDVTELDENREVEPFRCMPCSKSRQFCSFTFARFPCTSCVAAGIEDKCVSAKTLQECIDKMNREKKRPSKLRGGPFIPSYYTTILPEGTPQGHNSGAPTTSGLTRDPQPIAPTGYYTALPFEETPKEQTSGAPKSAGPASDPQLIALQPVDPTGGLMGEDPNISYSLQEPDQDHLMQIDPPSDDDPIEPSPKRQRRYSRPKPCNNCRGSGRELICGNTAERPCPQCVARGERCETTEPGHQNQSPIVPAPIEPDAPSPCENCQGTWMAPFCDRRPCFPCLNQGLQCNNELQGQRFQAVSDLNVPRPARNDARGASGAGAGLPLPNPLQNIDPRAQVVPSPLLATPHVDPRSVVINWHQHASLFDQDIAPQVPRHQLAPGEHEPMDVDDYSNNSDDDSFQGPAVFINGTEVSTANWSVPNIPKGYENLRDGLEKGKTCKELAGFQFWDNLPNSFGVGGRDRTGSFVENYLNLGHGTGAAVGRFSNRLHNRNLCGTRYLIGFDDETNRKRARDPAKDCDHALDNDMCTCLPCHNHQTGRMRHFQGEDDTIKSTKHYLCDPCNQKLLAMRSNPDGVPGLRFTTCDCVEQMRSTWLCNAHRVLTKVEIQYRAYKSMMEWDGGYDRYTCPGCRVEQEGDGPDGAWRCRSCMATVTVP